jgi:DNA-binding beta-propeller fold protein YncE
MRPSWRRGIALAIALPFLATVPARPAPANRAAELPGGRPDGSVLLPNGWSLHPAGEQIPLGDFPVNIAVHPDGRYAAILHAGYGQHEVRVVDVPQRRVTSRAPLDLTFYGLTFSADGRRLFCSGAAGETIGVFNFADGQLVAEGTLRLRDPKQRGIPGGLALTRDGQTLFVANVWGQSVSRIDVTRPSEVKEVLLGPAGVQPGDVSNLLRGSSGDPDLDAITKRDEALRDPTRPEAPFPFACLLDEKPRRLYVSLWAQAEVAVLNADTLQVLARWKTEEHPNEMVLARRGRILFVANANRNTVTVLDTRAGQAIETLSAALYPASPPGSTPNSLALSPDEKTLFVANACNNTVAVFDVTKPGRSRSLGAIPTGWYPTSVRVTPDGRHLLVANGKGAHSMANPNGPQPGRKAPSSVVEYIGGLFQGTLSLIDLPDRKHRDRALADWTVQARRCSPLQPDAGVSAPRPAENPIPLRPGDSSPIRYCIYIIKENRTYDQVFGDVPEGNGDPQLCLFPERVTPNHHRLAHEFVLLDNFYVEGEVSADGHEWSMAAYATDFVEKSWPLSYGHNRSGKFPYPSEGGFAAAFPAGGYLWDRAREAGVSYRSYGEFIANGKTPNDPGRAKVKSLEGHFDPLFRSFDMNYSDLDRAARFVSELKRFEAEGDMPRLQILRLPNDHTAGTSANVRTPTAFVAENDLALGQVIEAISRSRFWPQTAVFVVEDDAQNGPDHVDAHRTVAFVMSPYVRRGSVDSTLYSTSSMLRTMELILGLRPMTQFDAAATPMFNAFQPSVDLKPYQARPANVDLWEKNAATAWGGDASRRMDFSQEDAADDLLLNEVIWRSVKGPHHPMPAPVRAAFVYARPSEAGERD